MQTFRLNSHVHTKKKIPTKIQETHKKTCTKMFESHFFSTRLIIMSIMSVSLVNKWDVNNAKQNSKQFSFVTLIIELELLTKIIYKNHNFFSFRWHRHTRVKTNSFKYIEHMCCNLWFPHDKCDSISDRNCADICKNVDIFFFIFLKHTVYM